MRFLIWLTFGLAALYSGYWVVGRSVALDRIEAEALAFREAGGEVAWDNLSLIGFPSRFDVTVEGLRAADPARGLVWEAPWFQVLALSYRPTHVIAVWPPEQQVTLPGLPDLTLQSESLRASAVVGGVLESMTLEGQTLTLSGNPLIEGTAVERVLAALREVEGAQDLHLDATGVTLPAPLLAQLRDALPARLDSLRLTAQVRMNAPFTLPLTALDLTEARLIWGDLDLTATGRIAPDAAGLPEGQITLRLREGAALARIARASGLVSDGQAMLMTGMLAGMTAADGSLELPLTVTAGQVSLSGLPLGPLPLF